MFPWIILFRFLADNLFINKFISVNNCCISSAYNNDVECKLKLCGSNYLLSILPTVDHHNNYQPSFSSLPSSLSHVINYTSRWASYVVSLQSLPDNIFSVARKGSLQPRFSSLSLSWRFRFRYLKVGSGTNCVLHVQFYVISMQAVLESSGEKWWGQSLKW